MLLLCANAHAQPAGLAQNEAIIERVTRHLEEQTRNLPGKVTIAVAPLDDRTRLAACNELQLFMPAGARLWGQTSIGVRCAQPQPWQIFVPATIRVSGQVVVANRALSAGSVIDPADVGTRTEELTQLPSTVLLDPALAVGRTLAAGVPAGALLRNENLKQAWAVVQGQVVRIVYESEALRVTADGKAMGNAAIGQAVEVRVSSGKTVRGVARGNGLVAVQ